MTNNNEKIEQMIKNLEFTLFNQEIIKEYYTLLAEKETDAEKKAQIQMKADQVNVFHNDDVAFIDFLKSKIV